MNRHILADEVQAYLRQCLGQSPSTLALAKSPFEAVSPSELAEQLDGLQRSKHKLPRWHGTPGIYYPRKLSVEQSSSEATARYKSQLVGPHERVIDLTGGFGVDAFHLSRQAAHVTYVERSAELAAIVAHNMQVLGAQNTTCLAGDGVSHVLDATDGTYDTVYLDPSRRVQGQKVFRLRDCEPDIDALHPALLAKAQTVIVKAAPMLDISAALGQLAHVAAVHVLSIGNECKELLFVMQRGYAGEPTIVANVLDPSGTSLASFQFRPAEERDASVTFGLPAQYLYDPDAALMKSGAYKLIGTRHGLQKLHPNTHLYTHSERLGEFPGRTFRIDQTMPYAQFKKSKTPYAGNVTARNFPLKADALRQRHRIGEDSGRFLFFCTDADGQLIVIFASK